MKVAFDCLRLVSMGLLYPAIITFLAVNSIA